MVITPSVRKTPFASVESLSPMGCLAASLLGRHDVLDRTSPTDIGDVEDHAIGIAKLLFVKHRTFVLLGTPGGVCPTS